MLSPLRTNGGKSLLITLYGSVCTSSPSSVDIARLVMLCLEILAERCIIVCAVCSLFIGNGIWVMKFTVAELCNARV